MMGKFLHFFQLRWWVLNPESPPISLTFEVSGCSNSSNVVYMHMHISLLHVLWWAGAAFFFCLFELCPYRCPRNAILDREQHVIALGCDHIIRRCGDRNCVVASTSSDRCRHFELEHPLALCKCMRHKWRAQHVHFKCSLPLGDFECESKRLAVVDDSRRLGDFRPQVVASAKINKKINPSITTKQNQDWNIYRGRN